MNCVAHANVCPKDCDVMGYYEIQEFYHMKEEHMHLERVDYYCNKMSVEQQAYTVHFDEDDKSQEHQEEYRVKIENVRQWRVRKDHQKWRQ